MRFALAALSSFLIVLIIVSPLASATTTAGDSDGPSAKGKFEIVAAEGVPSRSIEFNAQTTVDGNTVGEVIFQDTSATEQSRDKDNEKPLYVRAECDCLIVRANKAVMSGRIVQSNVDSYVGRRVLVVAQDNGGSVNPLKHDKVTYGLYRLVNTNWVIADAERPDESSPVSLIATDAERPDDIGVIAYHKEDIGCSTFPLSSFSFLDATSSHGTVKVRP